VIDYDLLYSSYACMAAVIDRRAFVASSFVTAAYALLTAIFVTKTINTRWLHHVDLVRPITRIRSFVHQRLIGKKESALTRLPIRLHLLR
jgi:hypothetical protein